MNYSEKCRSTNVLKKKNGDYIDNVKKHNKVRQSSRGGLGEGVHARQCSHKSSFLLPVDRIGLGTAIYIYKVKSLNKKEIPAVL